MRSWAASRAKRSSSSVPPCRIARSALACGASSRNKCSLRPLASARAAASFAISASLSSCRALIRSENKRAGAPGGGEEFGDMSKRSVLAHGLRVRSDCRNQLGCDHLRIDAIAPFGDGCAQREKPAFGANFACESVLGAWGCRWIRARQEGHATKFGSLMSNFRLPSFQRSSR